jgi:hypothetical protein
LQKIIEQGYQISLADYIVSMKGNLYGSVGYYDPNNDVGGSNTLDVLLKTHYSEGESNWLENFIHGNDGLGGLGSAFEHSSSSFRLNNGVYNGSEFSFKSYSSGWGGGSRAGITTYKVANFGKNLARGSLMVGGLLGGLEIIKGMQKDGWSYGAHAQLSTGSAVGGIVGAEIGSDIGAVVIGGVIGFFTGGAGLVPGAVIGGIIGGWIGGWCGSSVGKDLVEDLQ